MPKTERVREELFGPFDESYFQTKMNKGWRLFAVHWERDVPGEATEQAAWIEEVPYGLRVADDCIHLEENPVERLTMQLMLTLISGDKSMSQIAEELNRQGSRTRRGIAWTQTAVFNMLPRLIEAAPYIWRSESTRATSGDRKL